jgi:hypothetical protein
MTLLQFSRDDLVTPEPVRSSASNSRTQVSARVCVCIICSLSPVESCSTITCIWIYWSCIALTSDCFSTIEINRTRSRVSPRARRENHTRNMENQLFNLKFTSKQVGFFVLLFGAVELTYSLKL